MIKVMGNSKERVIIEDLNDVIYYKQLKEYTDQEFESSKALKREKLKARIIVLEDNPAVRGSNASTNKAALNIDDLRLAIREILPELKGTNNSVDIKSAIREMAPLIVDMVRQEISRLPLAQQAVVKEDPVLSQFQEPTYVPTVSTAGMTSNIESKKVEVSGSDTNDAIAALRRLNKINNPK
jgi:hypothetical protein